MKITREFRGHFITAFDGAEYNKYYSQLSDKAQKYISVSDISLWIDENNGTIYEFRGNGSFTCEGNLLSTYNDFDELNLSLENEYDEIQAEIDICD